MKILNTMYYSCYETFRCIHGSRTIAPGENCLLYPNPNSNANLNSNPSRVTIFLGGIFPDTAFINASIKLL